MSDYRKVAGISLMAPGGATQIVITRRWSPRVYRCSDRVFNPSRITCDSDTERYPNVETLPKGARLADAGSVRAIWAIRGHLAPRARPRYLSLMTTVPMSLGDD